MFKPLHLFCLTSLLISPLTARADLIWYANFETYDTKSGAAPLQINTTGAPNTFSGMAKTDASLTNSSCQVVAGTTGNALSLQGTGNGADGSVSIRVNQSALKVPDKCVLVISFDLTRSSDAGFSLANEARAAKGRSGKAVFLPVGKTFTAAQRAVMVINQSGNPVALPGSLGELPDKSMASYFFDGKAYASLYMSRSDVLTLPITGFATGPSKSKIPAGVALSALLDNFGAWTSVADTVNNASVLSLPPGTVVSKP